LFRRTQEGAEDSVARNSVGSARKYFADHAFKASADKAFEAAGYSSDALEGEAYLRALPSLGILHRQKAANRKALFSILKELETRYSSRHREKEMVVKKPASRTAGKELTRTKDA
jgi:hypothetical protein